MGRELWDAYSRGGIPLGFDLVRDEPLPEGVHHLVVDIYTVTRGRELLVTQRDARKPWGLK